MVIGHELRLESSELSGFSSGGCFLFWLVSLSWTAVHVSPMIRDECEVGESVGFKLLI